jgi:hypothetical protein
MREFAELGRVRDGQALGAPAGVALQEKRRVVRSAWLDVGTTKTQQLEPGLPARSVRATSRRDDPFGHVALALPLGPCGTDSRD